MGTSVIAFVNIKEGEIICRYPGKIRSGNKALKYISKTEYEDTINALFLFLFKHDGRQFAVDALRSCISEKGKHINIHQNFQILFHLYMMIRQLSYL